MTLSGYSRAEAKDRALRLAERERLIGQVILHVEGCAACQRQGGLDAASPAKRLCVKARALLKICDNLE